MSELTALTQEVLCAFFLGACCLVLSVSTPTFAPWGRV